MLPRWHLQERPRDLQQVIPDLCLQIRIIFDRLIEYQFVIERKGGAQQRNRLRVEVAADADQLPVTPILADELQKAARLLFLEPMHVVPEPPQNREAALHPFIHHWTGLFSGLQADHLVRDAADSRCRRAALLKQHRRQVTHLCRRSRQNILREIGAVVGLHPCVRLRPLRFRHADVGEGAGLEDNSALGIRDVLSHQRGDRLVHGVLRIAQTPDQSVENLAIRIPLAGDAHQREGRRERDRVFEHDAKCDVNLLVNALKLPNRFRRRRAGEFVFLL